jgi:exosortase
MAQTKFDERLIQAGIFLLLAMTAILIWFQSYFWGIREDYSFGYLVPVFVGYVIFDRWPRICAYWKEGFAEGLRPWPKVIEALLALAAWGALALGGLLFLLGSVTNSVSLPVADGSFMMTGGFIGLALGALYLGSSLAPAAAAGHPRFALGFLMFFIFPIFIWALSTPMYLGLENRVSTFLLQKVTFVVFNFFDLLGMPLERRGSVLMLPNGEVGVEEACSGIRSLMGCLFAGSFLSAVFLDKFWKKALLVSMAMILAVLTNLLRGLFLTGWAYRYGSEAIAGLVHDVAGYAVLGLTVLGLLMLLPLFDMKFKLPPPPPPRDKPDAPDSPENHPPQTPRSAQA